MTPRLNWLGRPLAVFAVAAVACLSLGVLPSPWKAWTRDGCELSNCYCEPIRDSFVAQPVSTYSNLAFLLAGLVILAAPLNPASPSNLIRSRPAYARVFGAAAIGIGAGSFFYHASLTRAGEWFDLVGTYLLLSFWLLYNLARLHPLSGATFAGLYLAVNTLGSVQMIVAREWQQVVFVGLAAGALVAEAWVWRRLGPPAQAGCFAAALLCFGIGAALWSVPCASGWPLPAHALWHTLSAVTIVLLFVHYRSGKN